jgi:hypothetical protein
MSRSKMAREQIPNSPSVVSDFAFTPLGSFNADFGLNSKI